MRATRTKTAWDGSAANTCVAALGGCRQDILNLGSCEDGARFGDRIAQ